MSRSGAVWLRCVVASIESSPAVKVATGVICPGYALIAKKGSMQYAGGFSIGKIGMRWRAEGQMRYFDADDMRPVIVGEPTFGGEFLPTASSSSFGEIASGWTFSEYGVGAPSSRHGNPEAQLVQRYVQWVGSPPHFLTGTSTKHGGVIDLLNRTTWTLIEAKASVADRGVREAFGQLHDYRRSFSRSPSLAVLLPEAPTFRMRDFLGHFSVCAIWETPTATFADSASGRLTRKLRTAYAARAR